MHPDDPDFQARLEAAQVYENLFVPAEFREWAPRLVAAAGVRAGERVLDVACGTGILAREAAALVGPSGFVAAVDIDPGMLAVAARSPSSVEWRHGSADALPYDNRSFDAVVSQFGLMFFPNRSLALREMVRVLKPRGRLAIAVWDTLENTPAYAALVALLERFAGPQAADALRAPFNLGDRDDLVNVFESAGLTEVEIDTHVGTARFPAIRTMVEAELRGWLPVAGIALRDDQMARIFDEAEVELAPYRAADGSVFFDSPAHIIRWTKS